MSSQINMNEHGKKLKNECRDYIRNHESAYTNRCILGVVVVGDRADCLDVA